jgi:phosphoglycerate dehydrogenase-like enzyme
MVTNGSGAHGPAIAEYVLGVILAHFKQLHRMRAAQLNAEWQPLPMRELGGSRVGVIGLGDLGSSTARLLRACGAKVRGLRRSGAVCQDVDELFGPQQLHAFLDGLEVLVVAAPLTRHTQGLIGAAELAQLAPGALLVNVGRGLIVDQAALLAALESGQLGGAALDVFPIEPLPADSPLWRMPGVFVSPHCADASPQSLDRGFLILLDNLERFARGRPLRNVVDRQQGY